MAIATNVNKAMGTFSSVTLANTATRVSLLEAPFTYAYDEAGNGSIVYNFQSPDFTPVDGAVILLSKGGQGIQNVLVSAATYAAMGVSI